MAFKKTTYKITCRIHKVMVRCYCKLIYGIANYKEVKNNAILMW